MTALDGGHRLLQREGRRRAQQSVADDVEALAGLAVGFPLRHIRRQDRRGVIDWWIDGAVLCLRMTPEMGDERILAIFSAAVGTFHKARLRHTSTKLRNYIDLGRISKMADWRGTMPTWRCWAYLESRTAIGNEREICW